ncbi:MAG: hypothetical protein O2800_01330 [Planctomycetota bacterium]|nr:hypothetical protein [Planctomycetota bacterium]
MIHIRATISLTLMCTLTMSAHALQTAWDIVSEGTTIGCLQDDGILEIPRGELILWTGERLPGTLAALVGGSGIPPIDPSHETTSEATVEWRHPRLGIFRCPLELVRSIRLSGPPSSMNAADEDTILLSNGDRVTGLVEVIADDLIIDSDGRRRRIALTTIVSVHLVGLEQPSTQGMVWLRDGTTLHFPLDGKPLDGRMWQAFTKVFAEHRDEEGATVLENTQRVLSLASVITVAANTTAPHLALPDPAAPMVATASEVPTAMGLQPIRMDAPSRIEGTVPFDHAVLSLRVHAQSPLARARLVVSQLGVVVGAIDIMGRVSHHQGNLNPTRLEVPLAKGSFAIELEEESDGPIGDRVEILGGMLIRSDSPTQFTGVKLRDPTEAPTSKVDG